MEKLEQKVRVSGYNDYIALDFVNEDGVIEKTPFYISNGKEIEAHWSIPSNERVDYPNTYDEWFDRYLFKMKDGQLTVAWLSGFYSTPQFTNVKPIDLIDWRFQFCHKIINK